MFAPQRPRSRSDATDHYGAVGMFAGRAIGDSSIEPRTVEEEEAAALDMSPFASPNASPVKQLENSTYDQYRMKSFQTHDNAAFPQSLSFSNLAHSTRTSFTTPRCSASSNSSGTLRPAGSPDSDQSSCASSIGTASHHHHMPFASYFGSGGSSSGSVKATPLAAKIRWDKEGILVPHTPLTTQLHLSTAGHSMSQSPAYLHHDSPASTSSSTSSSAAHSSHSNTAAVAPSSAITHRAFHTNSHSQAPQSAPFQRVGFGNIPSKPLVQAIPFNAPVLLRDADSPTNNMEYQDLSSLIRREGNARSSHPQSSSPHITSYTSSSQSSYSPLVARLSSDDGHEPFTSYNSSNTPSHNSASNHATSNGNDVAHGENFGGHSQQHPQHHQHHQYHIPPPLPIVGLARDAQGQKRRLLDPDVAQSASSYFAFARNAPAPAAETSPWQTSAVADSTNPISAMPFNSASPTIGSISSSSHTAAVPISRFPLATHLQFSPFSANDRSMPHATHLPRATPISMASTASSSVSTSALAGFSSHTTTMMPSSSSFNSGSPSTATTSVGSSTSPASGVVSTRSPNKRRLSARKSLNSSLSQMLSQHSAAEAAAAAAAHYAATASMSDDDITSGSMSGSSSSRRNGGSSNKDSRIPAAVLVNGLQRAEESPLQFMNGLLQQIESNPSSSSCSNATSHLTAPPPGGVHTPPRRRSNSAACSAGNGAFSTPTRRSISDPFSPTQSPLKLLFAQQSPQPAISPTSDSSASPSSNTTRVDEFSSPGLPVDRETAVQINTKSTAQFPRRRSTKSTRSSRGQALSVQFELLANITPDSNPSSLSAASVLKQNTNEEPTIPMQA